MTYRLKIHSKLLLAALSSSVLTVVAVLIYALISERSYIEHQTLGEVNQIIDTIEHQASAAAYTEDTVLSGEVIDGLLRNDIIQSATIFDEHKVLAEKVKNEIIDDGDFVLTRILHDPFSSERLIGQLNVVVSSAAINTRTQHAIYSQAAAITALTLLTSLVLLFSVRHVISKPLLSIVDGLHEVRIGRAEQIPRLSATRRQDELSQLIVEINELLAAQREAEAIILQDKRLADAASKAKTDFLNMMSHELKTPLNAVLGFAQVLELEDLNEEQLDYVKKIYTAGEHLLALITETLDIAKIEEGRFELNLESVSICKVIHDCVVLLTPLCARQGIVVSFNHTDWESMQVTADVTRLKQVIINLLSNAVKYNRKNGGIRIYLSEENRAIKVAVTDTGFGIPPEKLAELFQPFNRLDHQNDLSIEGTGIGLTITKKIVERMNGKIGVESELGVGSTFWFTVPLAV